MEKNQTTAAAETWVSDLELSRSQKSGVAASVLLAIALAVVMAVLLLGPVVNILGLQAIGA